ncbi:MAG: MAPEG family protein [Phyllobacteriaceae bacterium]|nr:MAPEG family protein [Phyllobacteriaceae bacterium]
MSGDAIFWPMIVQAGLTLAVYWLMSKRRREAIAAGEASTRQFRENNAEPARSLFVRNNLENQFELPVLFFAAVLALHATDAATSIAVALAWIFALTRLAHAYVHVTTNRIRYRRPLFIAGYFTVGGLWVLLAARLAGIS